MFIIIKHGDNRQFLANINCSVLLLTHYLRDKVGLHRTDSIDLCEENGTLKLIFLVKFPEDNASKFLTARGTYYVCKVERGATGTKNEHSYRAFHPLIKSPPQDLLDSLRNQCEYLEKSRLKMLKNQDGKKPPTMEQKWDLPAPAPETVRGGARWTLAGGWLLALSGLLQLLWHCCRGPRGMLPGPAPASTARSDELWVALDTWHSQRGT
uniref:Chromosome X open reading frame 65 n=1 Tax=Naja naja TaxID=35670 RepID=A0A8C6XL26_NAJNA